MAQVTVREHVVTETDSYGLEVQKSLNQDFVFVNDKLAGYLTYPKREFKPIVGWDNAHNDMVCRALEQIKGPEFGTITAIETLSANDLQQIDGDDE